MLIEILKKHPKAKLPERMTPGAAGFDVYAVERTALYPGVPTLVDTGLVIDVPDGAYFTLHMRSGVAYKNGISLVNDVGVIDSDYCGQNDVVKFAMIKHLTFKDIADVLSVYGVTTRLTELKAKDLFEPFIIEPGMRIGQILFHSELRASDISLEFISEGLVAEESRGGFGSSGQ